MSKCEDCVYYHTDFDEENGFYDEWCEIKNIYLHNTDCPNYEEWR